ncbi:methyltransferase domain-containing protein [Sinorhizobium medicae]|nr:methyltransferase domain-containing protein [Sinorhizobium medicae]
MVTMRRELILISGNDRRMRERFVTPVAGIAYDDESRRQRGEKNADKLHHLMDMKGKRVLEIGCQYGDTTRALVEKYDCEVVGIDIMRQDNWGELEKHPQITLLEADIAKGHKSLAESSFDRIISFVVWEHIRHPWSALSQCQKVLKPDGKKWLYANLYRSAIASHLTWATKEPWPHLTMSPSEIKEATGLNELRWYFWVNKLTYQQYLFYFRQLGFYVTWEYFIQNFFDEEYYRKNEQSLGLYPEWDLKTDFFQVILEFDKENPKQPIPDPVYRLKK